MTGISIVAYTGKAEKRLRDSGREFSSIVGPDFPALLGLRARNNLIAAIASNGGEWKHAPRQPGLRSLFGIHSVKLKNNTYRVVAQSFNQGVDYTPFVEYGRPEIVSDTKMVFVGRKGKMVATHYVKEFGGYYFMRDAAQWGRTAFWTYVKGRVGEILDGKDRGYTLTMGTTGGR